MTFKNAIKNTKKPLKNGSERRKINTNKRKKKV